MTTPQRKLNVRVTKAHIKNAAAVRFGGTRNYHAVCECPIARALLAAGCSDVLVSRENAILQWDEIKGKLYIRLPPEASKFIAAFDIRQTRCEVTLLEPFEFTLDLTKAQYGD